MVWLLAYMIYTVLFSNKLKMKKSKLIIVTEDIQCIWIQNGLVTISSYTLYWYHQDEMCDLY